MRVLLVDDHIPMRKEVKILIGREKDLDVVADVGSAEAALALVRQLRPDVVVMDIMLPRMNGIDATWAIMAECPGTRVIVFSNYSAPILIQAVLEAGALGFVCKPRALEELIPAIRSIGAGFDAYADGWMRGAAATCRPAAAGCGGQLRSQRPRPVQPIGSRLGGTLGHAG